MTCHDVEIKNEIENLPQTIESDRSQQSLSAVVEMLLRKGIRAY